MRLPGNFLNSPESARKNENKAVGGGGGAGGGRTPVRLYARRRGAALNSAKVELVLERRALKQKNKVMSTN